MPKKSNAIAQYATLVNFGLTEAPLTWNRYAAFLVLEGFFLTGVIKFIDPEVKEVLPLLGLIALIGLLVTILWHLLNMLGWLNQNVFYHYASLVKIKGVKLPTDQYNDQVAGRILKKILKPDSAIYKTAQLVPSLLIVLYSCLIVIGFFNFYPNTWCFYSSSGLILLIVSVAIYFTERYCLNRRVAAM